MLMLTFKVGTEAVGIDIRRLSEVIPRVVLQPLTGSPSWLAGVFVHHGRVVPVIDLFRLAGHGECPAHLSSRIILLPLDGDKLFGLLAAQVADLREVAESTGDAAIGSLGPIAADGATLLRRLDPDRLLNADDRKLLLAAAGGTA